MASEYQASDEMNFNFNRVQPNKRRFSDINEHDSSHTSGSLSKITSLNSDFEGENQGERSSNVSASTSGNMVHNGQNDHPESTDLNNKEKDSLDQNLYDNQGENSHSNFSEILGELGQEAKMIMLQYSQTFSDSEFYEQEGLQAVTDLAAHASVLEQRLKLQKELLCNRLKIITQNLKSEI